MHCILTHLANVRIADREIHDSIRYAQLEIVKAIEITLCLSGRAIYFTILVVV